MGGSDGEEAMEDEAIEKEGERWKETYTTEINYYNCELWYLLHQVPCGFIALGQCFDEERDY